MCASVLFHVTITFCADQVTITKSVSMFASAIETRDLYHSAVASAMKGAVLVT